MTSLPFKVLTVLFIISRRQFSPSHGKLEGVVKPTYHVLDVKVALPWLQIKSASRFDLKSHKNVKRHYHHSEVEAGSNWTGSIQDILTYITSRDSTSSCTWRECLLVSRKHDKLENAALRENYRHNGTNPEIEKHVGSTETVLLETVGSVVAHWCPSEVQKYFKVDFGRTLRTSTEWTFSNIKAWWRTRLKPSQVAAPVGFIFVAYLNTLML